MEPRNSCTTALCHLFLTTWSDWEGPYSWLYLGPSLPHIFKCTKLPVPALNSSLFINPNLQDLYTPGFQHNVRHCKRKTHVVIINSLNPAGECFTWIMGEIAQNCTMEDCIQKNICLETFLTFPTSNYFARFASGSTFSIKFDSVKVTKVLWSCSCHGRDDEGCQGKKCLFFAWGTWELGVRDDSGWVTCQKSFPREWTQHPHHLRNKWSGPALSHFLIRDTYKGHCQIIFPWHLDPNIRVFLRTEKENLSTSRTQHIISTHRSPISQSCLKYGFCGLKVMTVDHGTSSRTSLTCVVVLFQSRFYVVILTILALESNF